MSSEWTADVSASVGGLSSTLLIVFVVLKLTGVIDWSWWWVMSPLWISMLIVVVSIVVLVCMARSMR